MHPCDLYPINFSIVGEPSSGRPNLTMSGPSTIHKSAFGRTSLFLTGDDRVLTRNIRTVSGAMRRRDGSMYHNLSQCASHVDEIHCWHCCEPIKGDSFVVPKSYDAGSNLFYVYGHFDSLACCKAFILEQSSFDHGHQMNVFSKMVRDVYGIDDDIVEAPPRVSLKRFGGPFDAKDIKRRGIRARLVEPPFVSYCMLVEERNVQDSVSDTLGAAIGGASSSTAAGATVDDDEFSEPPPQAMYDSFTQKIGKSIDTVSSSTPTVFSNATTKRRKTKVSSSDTDDGLSEAAGHDAPPPTRLTRAAKASAQPPRADSTLRKFFKK